MANNPPDLYVYAIVALLPLSAGLLVFQVNPYNALVIRGILGAVAALVYAVLGGADVALTEALVGTLLAITLYAVAVRSSLVMRLGVLSIERDKAKADSPLTPGLNSLRSLLNQRHHMRLEVIPYDDAQTLHQALLSKDIHGTCVLQPSAQAEIPLAETEGMTIASQPREAKSSPYLITVRVQRLYEILQADLKLESTQLIYASVLSVSADDGSPLQLQEEQP